MFPGKTSGNTLCASKRGRREETTRRRRLFWMHREGSRGEDGEVEGTVSLLLHLPNLSTPRPISHLIPLPPTPPLLFTAACLMVQLLLSRSTTWRPGEQQPRPNASQLLALSRLRASET
ncbi:unnamed protein product [Pleuronectes platessa]|uniref:Uncharacterized protein n=1 Tax=Pleuronectes platessa TaxID=8262 RepID=A0A9N7UZ97_PLEPL|nr:unnamed protein product [Pleuronectes platessa]